MRRRISALLLAILILLPAAANLVRAAQTDDLYDSISRQIRSFASASNYSGADDNAASILAKHGITSRSTLNAGPSHALTVTLVNSNLMLEALARTCTQSIKKMQHTGLKTGYTKSGVVWDASDYRFSVIFYPTADRKTEEREWLWSSSTMSAAPNSYDRSLCWMAGNVDLQLDIIRESMDLDTITYRVDVTVKDDFDFNPATAGSVSGSLASIFGSFLFREFSWISTTSFRLSVPNGCDHHLHDYRWDYDPATQTLHSQSTDGCTSNPAEKLPYTHTDGESSWHHKLNAAVQLRHDRPWVMEYTMRGYDYFKLAPMDPNGYDPPHLYHSVQGFYVSSCQRSVDEQGQTTSQWHRYGQSYSGKFSYSSVKPYTFRLENVPDGAVGNMIWLSVTEAETGKTLMDALPLNVYHNVVEGTITNQHTIDNWVSGRDLVIQYIGYNWHTLKEAELSLTIWENGPGGRGSCIKEAVTAPTCEAAGYTTQTCSLCGASSRTTQTQALGHSWNGGEVTKEATEEAEGIRTYTCTACSRNRTESIPKLEHVHSYIDTITQPTCTEAGFTTHNCKCGDSFTDTPTEATGHNFGAWTATKAPSCTQAGEDQRSCGNCGLAETREAAALGHSYTFGKCTRCNETDPDLQPGDLNADGSVNSADAVALLWHSLFGDPIAGEADLNRDGTITEADAVYLLLHTLFPGHYTL